MYHPYTRSYISQPRTCKITEIRRTYNPESILIKDQYALLSSHDSYMNGLSVNKNDHVTLLLNHRKNIMELNIKTDSLQSLIKHMNNDINDKLYEICEHVWDRDRDSCSYDRNNLVCKICGSTKK